MEVAFPSKVELHVKTMRAVQQQMIHSTTIALIVCQPTIV